MNVSVSISIAKPASEVAEVICDFARLAEWQAGVERCEVEGEGEGAVRTFVLNDKTYRDRLVNRAHDGLGYVYEQLEGPLPVASLRAFVAVSADSEESCHVDWTAEVDPGMLPAPAVESALASITEAGLKLFKKKLDLGDQWPSEG